MYCFYFSVNTLLKVKTESESPELCKPSCEQPEDSSNNQTDTKPTSEIMHSQNKFEFGEKIFGAGDGGSSGGREAGYEHAPSPTGSVCSSVSGRESAGSASSIKDNSSYSNHCINTSDMFPATR